MNTYIRIVIYINNCVVILICKEYSLSVSVLYITTSVVICTLRKHTGCAMPWTYYIT